MKLETYIVFPNRDEAMAALERGGPFASYTVTMYPHDWEGMEPGVYITLQKREPWPIFHSGHRWPIRTLEALRRESAQQPNCHE